MATVTSKTVVDEIIANDGLYHDDPPVVMIVEYENMFNGDKAWGLIYEYEDTSRYHRSEACINPKTIWERGLGVVNHG